MTTESATPQETRRCANCAAPLHGPYCYACGQPEKGLIRHLSGVLADTLDTVLNIDSRVFRSFWPLLARPGFLTIEYFAGRRVRYVTPVRLFFFLCIIAFFAAQTYLNVSGVEDGILNTAAAQASDVMMRTSEGQREIRNASRRDDIKKLMDKQLADLATAKLAPNIPDEVIKTIELAEQRVRDAAKKRLAVLEQQEKLHIPPPPPPPVPGSDEDDDERPLPPSAKGTGVTRHRGFAVNGNEWDPKKDPIDVKWLPAAANAKLNELAANAQTNLIRAKEDPKRLLPGLFGVLPQTLFVLMPLFAVLLKFFYLFKRRLYMEHLIVALHSHAFLFQAILVMTLCGFLQLWTAETAPFVAGVAHWIVIGLCAWIPIYLLLMQKRVYRQGWIMTVLKFGVIGICYTVLVSIGVALAFVWSLTAVCS